MQPIGYILWTQAHITKPLEKSQPSFSSSLSLSQLYFSPLLFLLELGYIHGIKALKLTRVFDPSFFFSQFLLSHLYHKNTSTKKKKKQMCYTQFVPSQHARPTTSVMVFPFIKSQIQYTNQQIKSQSLQRRKSDQRSNGVCASPCLANLLISSSNTGTTISPICHLRVTIQKTATITSFFAAPYTTPEILLPKIVGRSCTRRFTQRVLVPTV